MKKTLSLVAPAVLALFTAPLAAQCHPTLAITGSLNPGHHISLTLTGAHAHTAAYAAISSHLGTTTLHFGTVGTLTLELASPLTVVPLGMTDAQGALHLAFDVPPGIPVPPSATAFVEVVTGELTGGGPGHPHSLSFCTSNVAPLHIGA